MLETIKERSRFHLRGDQRKRVNFILVKTHLKNGFHLGRDQTKGVGFIFVETKEREWISS